MTTVIKFMFTMIAIVMGYAALLTSANAEPTKGELRHLVIDRVAEVYPQCKYLNRKSIGDDVWCSDRMTVLMDDDLNKLYGQVMKKFRLLQNKKNAIRETQREWIRYRDSECVYRDTTDGNLVSKTCVLDSIALAIHYLTRLKEIQFDGPGLHQIDAVIQNYKKAVS
jgi:uncharacterized protein YecT (DUF1311 family)